MILKLNVLLVGLSISIALSICPQIWAQTPISTQQNPDEYQVKLEQYLAAVNKARELVGSKWINAAKQAFNDIKSDFPDLAEPDFDIFAKAEMHFCKSHYIRAAKSFRKFLDDFPNSRLSDYAIERQFEIGKAYLAGRKRSVLLIFRTKGYAEGIKIMEEITEHAGLENPEGLGLKAALAVAKHYEQRKKYPEAHLKWSEIASAWQTGPIGRDALLGMARCKQTGYNLQPEHRRHLYDSSRLQAAQSYYRKFRLQYPDEAEKLEINEKLREINEQLAYKELTIGQYYQRTGEQKAANLYFNMVVRKWPSTEAAQTAQEIIGQSAVDESVN